MKSIDILAPTDEHKELLFRLGMLKIVEIIFEGMPPVDRLRKNVTYITEKTGLTEEQIWECYEFASESSFAVGRPRARSTVGFKSK